MLKMILLAALGVGVCSPCFAMENIEADAAYEREIKEQIRIEFTQGLQMLKAQADTLGVTVRDKDLLTLQQHMYEKALLMASCFDKAVTIKKGASKPIALEKYVKGCVETHLKWMASKKDDSLKCILQARKFSIGSGNDPRSINPPYDFLKFERGSFVSATDLVALKDCYDSRSEADKMIDRIK
ncbi:hypothetical protein ACO2JO_18460 [Leptospira interrogans]